MGLLQKACETYDCMGHLVGAKVSDKEVFAPISHTVTRASIEITLNQDGKFITARAVDKKDPKIAIPVTEKSAGRSSGPCAHPLCDQLGYLSPGIPAKHKLYLEQLLDWESSVYTHPKLTPILHYIQEKTILHDLKETGLIEQENINDKNEKLMVCWVVNGLGDKSGPCWEDRELMECFIQYYNHIRQKNSSNYLCMVSGNMEAAAEQHPKGVVAKKGNAKLISANDSTNFTYRGRFTEEWQAATVGYMASQKAHNALRWLVANQGVAFGERTFLCWNPQGYALPEVTGFMSLKKGTRPKAANPTEYRQQLKDALFSWKKDLPNDAKAIIVTFDAATTGRLAVSYYGELLASDFLERLRAWDECCCWENGIYGIQPPALYKIVNWAFGTPRNGKIETDPKILAQQMQRLMACRLNEKNFFVLDIEKALVEKASHLALFEKNPREELLFTACAVIRKYRKDYFKEEWDMSLDKENTNRSYLFGRLLAIAEIVERSTYSKEEERETNAMRMQKAFALRPMATWRMLEEKLEPYYKRLGYSLRQYYRKIAGEIFDKLSPLDADLNHKLDDIYLLGYYHQRAECYRSKKTEETTTEN
jgi:CRISPR-associated protein Csd1